jgi:cell wall-associated NlpC family hydrolase
MFGPLENVAGGDGVLDTTGDLGVVDTTGIGGPGDIVTELPYDPTLGPGPALGAAGLQDDPVIGSGPAGLQYDPIVEDPLLGKIGGQPGLAVDGKLDSPASGQPGLQPASGAPKAAGPASGNAIVAEAMSWLGTPYSFGGTSRDGISCSGLVMMAYQKLGISLPNSPGGQLAAVGKLNSGPAPAGSIVFFSEDGSGTPTHVGIANGDGTMTDANIVKGQVGITPIDIVTGYMGWGTP